FLPAIIDPEYHYEYINVESQQNNSSWLLWWMKRLIGLRKQHPAFGRGTMEMLLPDNNRVLTYIRRFEGETILVAANLSRFSQAVELDLSEFAGATPLELFGHSQFPVIGDEPYFLSLGPHAFHWFVLESSQVGVAGSTGAQLPELTVRGPWSRIVEGQRPALKRVLQDMLQTRRWFGAKNRRVSDTQVLDAVPIGDDARIVLVRVEYFDGEAETYLVPIRYLPADLGDEGAALLRVRSSEGEGFIVDAVAHEDVQRALL
ncbi:MAG: alpha-glucosidase C-terminal domain-containing protein, partial [Dehalococcoidia bacterium]|nr:alpha-glucosidase C-terminal domain-containing protein [Dehalococcoidia bacterium]